VNALKRWFKFVVWVEPVKLPPGYEIPSLVDRFKFFIGIRGRF
jgi:hypothetical protein